MVIYKICFMLAICAFAGSCEKKTSQERLFDEVYDIKYGSHYNFIVICLDYDVLRLHRVPTFPQSYDTNYVQIKKIDSREIKGITRETFAVLRTNNVFNRLADIGYMYVDFSENKLRVYCREIDDSLSGSDWVNTVFRDICPFYSSRSPIIGFENDSISGYRSGRYWIEYLKKRQNNNITLEVIYTFDKKSNILVGDDNYYYSSNDEIENKTGENFHKLAKKYEFDNRKKYPDYYPLWKENQKWVNEKDWMWNEMERYDGRHGYLLMKCIRVK